MVLLRVRSQGDALFRHSIVPWIVDEGYPLIKSLDNILPELRSNEQMSREQFLGRYELWYRGHFLDLNTTPEVAGLRPGAEVFVKPRGNARYEEKVDKYLSMNSTLTSEGSATRDRPQQGVQFQDASSAAVQSQHQHPELSSDRVQATALLFAEFLEKHQMTNATHMFYKLGVRTLVELCCRTSTEIATAVASASASLASTPTQQQQVVAYRLITAAHQELVSRGITFSWTTRFEQLYVRYNNSKVSQVRSLMEAYQGDEEDLWMALREKYEPAVAELADPTSPLRRNGPGTGNHASPSRPHPAASTVDPSELSMHLSSVVGADSSALKNKPPAGHVSQPHLTRSEAQESPPPGYKQHNQQTFGQSTQCPACRHHFTVDSKTELKHMHEIHALQEQHRVERAEDQSIKAEMAAELEQLRLQLEDSAKLKDHYEKISREQQTWLGMLEVKLEQAEEEVVRREVAASKPWTNQNPAPNSNPNLSSNLPAAGGGNVSFNTSTGLNETNIPHASVKEDLSYSKIQAPKRPAGSSTPINATSPQKAQPRDPAVNASQAYEDRMLLRKKLVDFYIKYSPEKLELVDHVLGQWEGRESELERLISVEPSVARMARSNAGVNQQI